VDFRHILRPLSDRFKVKVEMKQIGARQETGRIGGIGSCGRELCCSTWLTDFRSVTTSAARYQQLALNPQKLAGQCGKLKCCLNYELDMYIEAIKSYPSQNAKLKTRQGTGMHMKTDIFTERMWYLFKSPGSASVMAGFPIETVREILAQNKQGIEPDVDLNMVEAEEKAKIPQEATYENVVGQDELTRFDSKIKSGKRTKKRGGKDRKPQGGGGGQQAGPRPQGERGPRPEGQQGERAPRPERPPRPEGQQGERGPRPEGQPRGDRGRRDRGRGGRDRGPRPDRPQGGGGGGEAPPTPPSA
jgi:hypothetical protein